MVLSSTFKLLCGYYIAIKTNIMKKIALRFGLYGFYTILGIFLLSWLLIGRGPDDFGKQEIAGWLGIILSVSFVFIGMKYYRDRVNNGRLGFGEGLKLGVLIVLVPAVLYGLFSVLYAEVLDPDFLDKYYQFQISELPASLTATEREARMTEMQEQRELFANPLMQFIAMFLCVFAAGLIVAVLSALFLKRK